MTPLHRKSIQPPSLGAAQNSFAEVEMVFIVGDATECRAGHVEALACDHSSGFLAVLSRPNGPETAEDVAADRVLELWSLQPSLRKIGSAKFTLQSDGTRVASASILWHKDRSQLAVHCSNGDLAIFQIKYVNKFIGEWQLEQTQARRAVCL